VDGDANAVLSTRHIHAAHRAVGASIGSRAMPRLTIRRRLTDPSALGTRLSLPRA
jgi:hypothetical protein